MSIKIPKILENRFEPKFLEIGEEIVRNGEYSNFDFVRNSFCAYFKDKHKGYWAYLKKKHDKDNYALSCDCNTFKRHMMCQHLAALAFLAFSSNNSPKTIYDNIAQQYYSSLWTILAKGSYELYGNKKFIFQADIDNEEDILKLICQSEENQKIFHFDLPGSYWGKFWIKFRYFLAEGDRKKIDHALSAKKIISFSSEILNVEKTELEERMNQAGYKSWQQKFEESLWFDFGKIWFLTLKNSKLQVNYDHELQCLIISSKKPEFKYLVQKSQIPKVLNTFTKHDEFRELIKISDENIILNYSLTITDNFDLKITPVLVMPDTGDSISLTEDSGYNIVSFGRFIYLESSGFFPFERAMTYFDSNIFNFNEVIIPNEKIPDILNGYKKQLNESTFHYVTPSLLHENYVSSFESTEVIVDSIEDDWCYLDIRYQYHNEMISFADIYKALQKGKRYIIGKEYWIDLELPEFEWISDIKSDQILDSEKNAVKLKMNRLNFYKMRSVLPEDSQFTSHGITQELLHKILNFEPSNDTPGLDGRKYTLRDYQITGYGWLWFLYENGLSGLLCDDMGLGKTYQSLALLDAITLIKKTATYLVVCPTSVIPHWRDKLSQFRKKVNLHVYHGSERELKDLSKEKFSVILTSYGIIRNDLHILESVQFEVMIFDEVQLAKNKASLTYAALSQLNGRMKIGLTGTPIENDLTELKALFDIALPNYLGSDRWFKRKYSDPIESVQDNKKIERLHRLISPFILRRTKEQVLEELPPKTEDIRKCELSPDQVKLYKDVIGSRGASLIQQLDDRNQKIPYLHIFAVLNYLKQICNHPAQLEDHELDYRKYSSGKWDLFCELLDESLNSGYKTVIFSQYLNMLALIEQYLNNHNIQFATIKGSTQNRGAMIDRFNNDPACMVFTGSLKAAGLGINLTGGSVVIHYDRWWNAAREDQATDRVHRIGQTRGVQVFKLITEGTLEEKIDRLIQKKKSLMESLIKEDDAGVIKKFDRDELRELLMFDENVL